MEYKGIEYKLNLNTPMISEDIKNIKIKLAELGYIERQDIDTMFDIETETAIKKYQANSGLTVTGTVNKSTWDSIFIKQEPFTPQTRDKDNNQSESYAENNEGSFFNKNNRTNMRKNNQDIVITLGNEHRIRTIKNVIFRGKNTVIGIGGQPVAESYEFIAKDIIESEEEDV